MHSGTRPARAGEARASGALQWLSRLSWSTARAWGIASQIYLQLEEYSTALHAAEQALHLLPAHHPNHGRAVATLGQIYIHLQQPQRAVEFLLLAVELLEQAKDMLGMARVSNNLAVAYLGQPPNDRTVAVAEIQRLLLQAQQIQSYSGDAMGLAITRQNLEWLRAECGFEPPV